MTDLVRAMAAMMSVDAGEEHRPEQPRQSSATQTQSKWNLETETAPEKGAVNADEAYVESYIQTDSEGYFRLGRPPCHPGCNPDGKVPAAKWRFSLAIQLHPCRIGSSAGHRTPAADPSLPTTEEGISGRGWQKTDSKTAGVGLHLTTKFQW